MRRYNKSAQFLANGLLQSLLARAGAEFNQLEDTSMKIVSTGLTRRILKFVIGLHRCAVVAECEALDRRAPVVRPLNHT